VGKGDNNRGRNGNIPVSPLLVPTCPRAASPRTYLEVGIPGSTCVCMRTSILGFLGRRSRQWAMIWSMFSEASWKKPAMSLAMASSLWASEARAGR